MLELYSCCGRVFSFIFRQQQRTHVCLFSLSVLATWNIVPTVYMMYCIYTVLVWCNNINKRKTSAGHSVFTGENYKGIWVKFKKENVFFYFIELEQDLYCQLTSLELSYSSTSYSPRTCGGAKIDISIVLLEGRAKVKRASFLFLT